MSTKAQHIRVEFSEDGLFGSTDPQAEGIDAKASAARFAESLENYLYDAYPDAEIEISQGINDRHSVDGDYDHTEIPSIGQIIERCWNGDDWLVYRDS